MGSKPKSPPKPPPTPPPIRSTGADRAQDALNQSKREKKRYDFSKTILSRGSTNADGVNGIKNTLG